MKESLNIVSFGSDLKAILKSEIKRLEPLAKTFGVKIDIPKPPIVKIPKTITYQQQEHMMSGRTKLRDYKLKENQENANKTIAAIESVKPKTIKPNK